MKALLSEIYKKFESFRPGVKKRAIWAGLILLLVLGSNIAYRFSRPPQKPLAARPGNGIRDLTNKEAGKLVEVNTANDSARKDQEIALLKAQLEGQMKQAGAGAGSPVGNLFPHGANAALLPPNPSAPNLNNPEKSAAVQSGPPANASPAAKGSFVAAPAPQAGKSQGVNAPAPRLPNFPLPPLPGTVPGAVPGAVSGKAGYPAQLMLPASASAAPPQPDRFGDIELFENQAAAKQAAGEAKTDKKKEVAAPKREFYLPPSFMPGMLLTGLNAPTSEDGKSNPLPAIVRVSAPAILPNDVRRDLSGCFLIIECTGSLADERVHARLVSLSCLSKSGEAVIDEKVAGFIEDSDGTEGIAGTVVTKMGSLIARSMFAGFVQGLGDATKQVTMSSSLTALGTVTTPSTSLADIGIAGVGNGVANAGAELQKFYMTLVRQTMPVVTTLPAKNIRAIITKGVTISVREFKRSDPVRDTKRSSTW
jgi:conjugal transfer pilus assembly protein TraB